MRFFLDQNVDARVAAVLRELGHPAWTADESGLSREADPNLTIYAHNHDAVLLTHDREFSQRFKRHIVGRHIYLDCRESVARDVVHERMPGLIDMLEHVTDVYVGLRQNSLQVTYSGETW